MNHLFVKRCKTGFVANSAPSSTDRTQWLGSCIYLSYSPKKHGFHTANKWQELFHSFTPDSTNVLSKSGDWNHSPLTLPVTSVYAYRSDIHVVDRECQFLGKAPRIWWGLKKRKKNSTVQNERYIELSSNKDETGAHYTEWSKPER